MAFEFGSYPPRQAQMNEPANRQKRTAAATGHNPNGFGSGWPRNSLNADEDEN